MNPKTRGLDDVGQIFQLDVGIWGFHVKFAVDQPFFRREPQGNLARRRACRGNLAEPSDPFPAEPSGETIEIYDCSYWGMVDPGHFQASTSHVHWDFYGFIYYPLVI